ncbi:g1206 [Coccomyxa elongata]
MGAKATLPQLDAPPSHGDEPQVKWDVGSYEEASKVLKSHVMEVLTSNKWGFQEKAVGQTAKEASAFWVNSGALVIPHDFLSFVKQGVVQIDVDLELRQVVPGAAEKLLTSWKFTFDADHTIEYEGSSRKKRPYQPPHFGFTIMRHHQRDVGGSSDSLTRPGDKLSVAAHLYVPKGAGEPAHFRRDKDAQSEAIKVTPCCSATVPYRVPYLKDHVEPIVYKSKCLRKMYFRYTCYSHKTARVA